jgi:hypothetical protein
MTHAKTATLALTAGIALVAASCATMQQTPRTLDETLKAQGYRIAEPVDRVYNYTINGWNYVDRDHLILLDGVNRHYLVTFRNQCHGLPGSALVAYTTTASQLTAFDKFLVKDPASKIIDRCYIESLHRLDRIS